MGTTDKYQLPFPNGATLLKDVAGSIAALAQAVEDALRAPLLVTDGTGITSWSSKVAEVGWDVTDNPDRKRGSWDSHGSADQLVTPSATGYYLVATSVRFGGKAEPDWFDVQINTRQVGSDNGSGTTWARARTAQPDSTSSFTQVALSTIVRIGDTSPHTGIAVRLQYGGANNPPDVPDGVQKLRVYRLSAL